MCSKSTSRVRNISLDLVDLPGFTHDGRGVVAVALAVEYMRNPRSIILAVVSASADPDTQQVLQLAEQYDPEGHRTLGILTKPDKTDKDTDLEISFIRMAKNEDVERKFLHGWHVLMNGAAHDGHRMVDLATREQAERDFFADKSGRWCEVPRAVASDPSVCVFARYY